MKVALVVLLIVAGIAVGQGTQKIASADPSIDAFWEKFRIAVINEKIRSKLGEVVTQYFIRADSKRMLNDSVWHPRCHTESSRAYFARMPGRAVITP